MLLSKEKGPYSTFKNYTDDNGNKIPDSDFSKGIL